MVKVKVNVYKNPANLNLAIAKTVRVNISSINNTKL